MPEKKKLFAYCRVSTTQQKENKNIEIQQGIIKKYQKYYDNKYIITEWFNDDGVSAFTDRPQYDRMVDKIDECDGIIITKLDRIGRSVKQLSEFVDLLEKKNKLFIVVTQNIDTSTKEGRLLMNMLFAISEYEAALINERMLEGRAQHIANGGKIGRNTVDLEPYKSYIRRMYEVNKLGCGRIAKLLKSEHNIEVTYGTIFNRLKEWNIT